MDSVRFHSPASNAPYEDLSPTKRCSHHSALTDALKHGIQTDVDHPADNGKGNVNDVRFTESHGASDQQATFPDSVQVAEISEAVANPQPSIEEQNLAQLSGLADMWKAMDLSDQMRIITDAEALMKCQYHDDIPILRRSPEGGDYVTCGSPVVPNLSDDQYTQLLQPYISAARQWESLEFFGDIPVHAQTCFLAALQAKARSKLEDVVEIQSSISKERERLLDTEGDTQLTVIEEEPEEEQGLLRRSQRQRLERLSKYYRIMAVMVALILLPAIIIVIWLLSHPAY